MRGRKGDKAGIAGVILGLALVYLLVVVVLGPENRRRRMNGVEEDGMGEVDGEGEMEEPSVGVRYGVEGRIV